VITFSCGIGQEFDHGRDAWLLTNGTGAELAEAIHEIVNNNNLAKTLTLHSREKAEELFSWPRSVENMVEIYKATLLNPQTIRSMVLTILIQGLLHTRAISQR